MFFRRYVPETPRFLASQGRLDEANMVITRLARGKLSGRIDNPEVYITAVPGPAVIESKGHWKDALRGRLLKRTVLLCIAVCMSYAAQISMLTLMPTILVSRGYAVNTSLWFTLIMQSGSLIGAATAAFLASRFPRKKVLTGAAILGCAAALQ